MFSFFKETFILVIVFLCVVCELIHLVALQNELILDLHKYVTPLKFVFLMSSSTGFLYFNLGRLFTL